MCEEPNHPMPLNPEALRDLLAEANPEALLLGTETEFDPALLGIAERDGNRRSG